MGVQEKLKQDRFRIEFSAKEKLLFEVSRIEHSSISLNVFWLSLSKGLLQKLLCFFRISSQTVVNPSNQSRIPVEQMRSSWKAALERLKGALG
jgi:hypothetical protein